ncbi:MAG: aminoacyl--tRNA ligase-related protein, partial [Patescibacteria group bacterium]
MLDINFIIEHKKEVEKAIKHKRVDLDLKKLLTLHEQRLELLQTIEGLQQRRNEHTKKIKDAGGKPESAMIAEGKKIKDEITAKEPGLREVEGEYHAMMLRVPNVYSDDTPVGKDESGNKVLRTFGKLPHFAFKPKEHWELGESLGVLNIAKAAEVSGSRFNYLLGDLARMEFALIQFTLAVLTDGDLLAKIASRANLTVSTSPFITVVPPVLVRPGVMERMGRLEPRDERYHMEKDDLYLVGSAEHALGPLHMDETFDEKSLPRRYIGFSTAFRRESGSYGQDVKGILRVHQFDKL